MDIKSTLKRLSEMDGPSGREQAVAALVSQWLEPLCDEVRIDDMTNVIGLKRGRGPEPRPQVMLMAHLDEIQMMVSALDGPFLRFVQFSYDPRVLVGQEVTVFGRRKLHGVIGDRPPHLMKAEDRRRMPETNDLVIDLGLDAETVAEFVQVGDVALVARSFSELLGERVAGKAFDNRLSVTAMLATLDQLQRLQHPCDVLAVASVGEEFNFLGAKTATFQLQPDIAIVLDVTFGKQPGTPDVGSFALGSGPIIGIGPNLDGRLSDKLIEIGKDLEIPYDLEPIAAHSGTDAWPIQVMLGGIHTALVGIAIRNMHSPVEVADLRDVTRTARLLSAFLAEADRPFVDGLAHHLPDFEEETP
jgi:endoglucanase